jgi:hypothetical protein
MRYVPVAVAVLFSTLAANPVPEYFFCEFSADPSHQWLELHHWPEFTGPCDLTNWTLATTTSACTLSVVLPDQGYVVLDSAALATGAVGRGTFRLNPDCDTLILTGAAGEYDWLAYPSVHASQGLSPCPGPGTSASLYYRDDFEGPFINWYIDSTPTPGAVNDNYSSVAGRIRGERGEIFSSGTVWFGGQIGGCGACVVFDTTYLVQGLGPGRYRASFYGWFQNHYYRYDLPDSVDVGYSTVVPDIDLIVPLTAIGETQPVAQPAPTIRRQGRSLIAGGAGASELALFDQSGRLVMSALGFDVWGLDISSLRPGIYFARLKGADPSTIKVVIPR